MRRPCLPDLSHHPPQRHARIVEDKRGDSPTTTTDRFRYTPNERKTPRNDFCTHEKCVHATPRNRVVLVAPTTTPRRYQIPKQLHVDGNSSATNDNKKEKAEAKVWEETRRKDKKRKGVWWVEMGVAAWRSALPPH